MRYGLCVLLLAGATLHALEKRAEAAEAATGVYLLGSRAAGAGITPPPGLYFNDDTYFYSGKIGGGTSLPTGGLLVANVSAQTWINLPTTIWVTPAKILGGDLAVSLTTPFGEPRVNANLLVNSPRFGPIGVNATRCTVQCQRFLPEFVHRMARRQFPLAAGSRRRHSVRHLCARPIVQRLPEPACHRRVRRHHLA